VIDGASKLTFVLWRSDTFERLDDVEVYIIHNDGSQAFAGKTNTIGMLTIDKNLLDQSIVVLFCKNNFFCGALFSSRSNFEIYREMTVYLAPFYT
jgi:hypothetical protein